MKFMTEFELFLFISNKDGLWWIQQYKTEGEEDNTDPQVTTLLALIELLTLKSDQKAYAKAPNDHVSVSIMFSSKYLNAIFIHTVYMLVHVCVDLYFGRQNSQKVQIM